MSSPNRRRVITGNWKMYKTQSETRAFFAEFLPLVADVTDCDIVVAPPFTSVAAAVEVTKGSNVDTHKPGNIGKRKSNNLKIPEI